MVVVKQEPTGKAWQVFLMMTMGYQVSVVKPEEGVGK